MTAFQLDPASTALILIDLQKGIVSWKVAPHAAGDVVERSSRLASRFRQVGALVVLVRVDYAHDFRDRLRPAVDATAAVNPPAADFAEPVPSLGRGDHDLVIVKHQWGAFYGTELDLQLRRRQIRTLVLGGIATNFGVESTARDAYERGYHQIFVEDAMASFDEAAHRFAVTTIFPRLGRIRSTEEVLKALAGAPGSGNV